MTQYVQYVYTGSNEWTLIYDTWYVTPIVIDCQLAIDDIEDRTGAFEFVDRLLHSHGLKFMRDWTFLWTMPKGKEIQPWPTGISYVRQMKVKPVVVFMSGLEEVASMLILTNQASNCIDTTGSVKN